MDSKSSFYPSFQPAVPFMSCLPKKKQAWDNLILKFCILTFPVFKAGSEKCEFQMLKSDSSK